MKPESDRLYKHGGYWAFLIVLVVCYAQVFLIVGGLPLTARTVAFVGCGLLYLGFGVFWFNQQVEQASLAKRLCYFGVQMPLAALILFLSPVPGNIGLVVFPLMSQTVFLLPPVLVGLFSALLFVLSLAHLAAPYGWGDAYRYGLGFAAATSFGMPPPNINPLILPANTTPYNVCAYVPAGATTTNGKFVIYYASH